MASGSEVFLCLSADNRLFADGIPTRVMSMHSWQLSERQSRRYCERVLPSEIKARVFVEQASTFGWSRYVGATGKSIGMGTFGAS